MLTKPVADLVPGDLIMVRDPTSPARVIKVLPSTTEIRAKSGVIGDAVIVCFVLTASTKAGFRGHDFAHPTDKVILP